MSILSLGSLIMSILGVLFAGLGLKCLFILVSTASLIPPPIAKKVRISREKTGEVPEVFAIIIGGFNFYSIIFALTKFPIFIGYLGWVIGGIAYKAISTEAPLGEKLFPTAYKYTHSAQAVKDGDFDQTISVLTGMGDYRKRRKLHLNSSDKKLGVTQKKIGIQMP